MPTIPAGYQPAHVYNPATLRFDGSGYIKESRAAHLVRVTGGGKHRWVTTLCGRDSVAAGTTWQADAWPRLGPQQCARCARAAAPAAAGAAA